MCNMIDNMFGGPSAGEQQAYDTQTGLTKSFSTAFNQQYQDQKGALLGLNNSIMRLQSGNTGPGFGGEENASRIAMIQNQGAASARNSIQAERERSAGVGGGGSTGLARSAAIGRQISGGMDALSGANTSNQLIAEQGQNFAQGRATAQEDVNNYHALAGSYHPETYGQMTSSSNQTQSNMAKQIQEEKTAAAQAEFGMLEKGVTMAATGGMGGFAALGGGEGMVGGLKDFASGASNSMFNTNFGISGPSGGGNSAMGSGGS